MSIYAKLNSKLEELVTPGRFLKIAKSQRNSIKRSTFVPPKLGVNNDFGRIKIEYYYGSKR